MYYQQIVQYFDYRKTPVPQDLNDLVPVPQDLNDLVFETLS